MFFLSHLIYSFSVTYGILKAFFMYFFYELILNPKLEYLLMRIIRIKETKMEQSVNY